MQSTAITAAKSKEPTTPGYLKYELKTFEKLPVKIWDDSVEASRHVARSVALARLLVYSLIGLVIFFVPFEIGGKSTIVLDHAASYLVKDARTLVVVIAMLLMAYGALEPWVSGSWRENAVTIAFSVLKVLGLAIGVAFLFGIGPEVVYAPGMLPFLFDKLVLSLAIIVPLGSLALVFLIGLACSSSPAC